MCVLYYEGLSRVIYVHALSLRKVKVKAKGSWPLGHMTRLQYVMCHVMVYGLSHMLSGNMY